MTVNMNSHIILMCVSLFVACLWVSINCSEDDEAHMKNVSIRIDQRYLTSGVPENCNKGERFIFNKCRLVFSA